ncbi:nodulation factor ABC transporter ATP-binding protein NodI [Cupriavidus sp.]|uniref:nodulation factor ABC transporter ATP-binding protein NodI n=2 Tax=unclassified Cupriavidus TaxID=2640874 RepID=UPI001C0003EC|nr:nodulation factor ABC transporter ATP-binding protein NodI [Cupriavidus sp.]QWE93581.1 nodulation factor ABC transporter ATP-binding protein NodI [Cupriavidus sp. EM10]MCA3186137.1 nodulation factor ABC transporter ATP-binding protein NodI [Cupriavidus sp.]MCA3191032.1 nodulation factor ABC transporter ATP-binding protein NodI [Cupriavidus sp.]MCA3199376.1 nodulation factor ABC transporter ATP-binding protein NodI [Cupriavidus sp.]MCA3204643.1 nodulation factor ABC transporter ATP-binding p
MTAILQMRNVRKRYGDQLVVDNLDLEVQPGQCFGLLGPNGAGKTTTLRMLLGLTTPESGTLTLCGEPIPLRAPQARMRVGVVPQFDNLDPDFSVIENLRIFGRYFGLSSARIAEQVPKLLEFARLENKAHAQVRDLSGGMRRRLTVARALINDPDLLVMDEPTTGLDPQARHLIWERLKSLLGAGKTILLTTHFMEEAERLCNHLCVIDAGRKIAEGKPHELIDREIGCDVVEVYGDELEPLRHTLTPLADRCEMRGETLFCYVRDPDPLLAALHGKGGVRYLHRPANLEDVFLKLTGREMRD